MIEYKLNIGDVATSAGPANYTCYGLGSCVGLFIQDRITGISGGAHIFLPENVNGSVQQSKFYCVKTAVDEILNQFKLQGSCLNALRAKLTGGASVVSSNMQTGKRNVEEVVKHLTKRRIFIAASDVGGSLPRTATFESNTGLLTVRIPVTNEYKIY